MCQGLKVFFIAMRGAFALLLCLCFALITIQIKCSSELMILLGIVILHVLLISWGIFDDNDDNHHSITDSLFGYIDTGSEKGTT